MFPTQSKAHRSAHLWLLPVFALVMLLLAYAVFAYSTADAQVVEQPDSDFCVEGMVINWEEKPLADWEITLENADGSYISTTVSAPAPDDDDDDPDLEKGEFEFTDLPEVADTYTATLTLQDGWSAVTPAVISFPIGMGEDDCIRIRFKVRRDIPVQVIKFDVNHVGLEGWKIKVEPGKGNLFAEGDDEKTDVTGSAFFTLTPGVWIFSEYPPKVDRDDPRESWMAVVPPSGMQMVDLEDRDYTEEELPIQIIFKNELMVGCIDVQKFGYAPPPENGTTEPGLVEVTEGVYTGYYGVPGWGFQLLRKDGSIARQGITDASGNLRFDGLPLGPYTLVEENRAGWTEIGSTLTPPVDGTEPTVDFTGRKVNVTVEGNHCGDNGDPIIFVNEQNNEGFCIEGYKIDANGGFGLPGWEISAEPLVDGGYEPDDVETDGTGYFKFTFPRNDYRIPGAKYEICEEEQDGWLPHTDTCQTVRLPEWPTGSCIVLKDFVNQQVGHSESLKKDQDKGGMWMGGGMSCSSYHVVKGGEGLYDIGRMYNKSPQQMLNANPDVKNNKHQWVYVGQKICIP